MYCGNAHWDMALCIWKAIQATLLGFHQSLFAIYRHTQSPAPTRRNAKSRSTLHQAITLTWQ